MHATQPETPPDEVLTPDETAAFLKVPARTLDAWRNRRTGPRYHRVGRHVRYLRAEVLEWLDAQAGDRG
ncbi:MAG: helix-turn-helix transcriptional regulator [Microthrixaceae bacterium]